MQSRPIDGGPPTFLEVAKDIGRNYKKILGEFDVHVATIDVHIDEMRILKKSVSK